MSSLDECLYETGHRNKKPLAVIADEIGITASYLYRVLMPDDSASGARFPLSSLVPLMRSTNDFRVLRCLARLCGFMVVKEPKFRGKVADELGLMAGYQEVTTRALLAMRVFFDEPSKEKYDALSGVLRDVMERSSGAEHYARKRLGGQIEMEL